MKCIHCGHDSRYKDRVAMGCPACRHMFAFEPQQGSRLTDMAFKSAIDRVSANGRVKFHADHLFHEVRRLGVTKGRIAVRFDLAGIGSVVLGALLLSWQREFGIALLVVGVALGVFGLVSRLKVGGEFDPDLFRSMLATWKNAHGAPPGLVEARPNPPALTPEMERELASYSFDRAVVTDRRAIVDVLVANNFHFEHNCAVLAVDRYPAHTFQTVLGMLRRNPRIEVLVVHDATPAGCRLAHRLRTDPAWFQGIGRVVDVGLRPHHHKHFKGLEQPAAGASEPHAIGGLTEAEARWLAENRLELTVVRPEQLVKRLHQAIFVVEARPAAAADGGGSGIDLDSLIESGEGEGDGGDSFG